MQERGDRHAAFWACPPCDCAFPSSSEFAEHLYTYHEEAVYADEAAGTYLTCSHCGQEVGFLVKINREEGSLTLW